VHYLGEFWFSRVLIENRAFWREDDERISTDVDCFRTWPVNEQVVDIVHKAVFAYASGYLCDLWIQ